MRKISWLLIICLAITALAGCARADESGEEFATLNQPEQIVQKDEVAEKEEPADIDSAEEPEEEPQVSEQPKEEPEEKEPEIPQTTEKKKVVYGSVPNGSQYELFAMPKGTGCVWIMDYSSSPMSFDEIQEHLDPARSLVVRGKINGKSTYCYGHCETPILVQEVYYGDAEVGDTILCLEEILLHLHDGKEVLHYFDEHSPLKKDEEYLFIFYGSKPMYSGGEEVYYPVNMHFPYIRIGDLERLQEKAQRDELILRHQRNLDALTYYYLGQRGEAAE